MRVIGGIARGRILHVPRGTKVRPTLDRIREAIFNILGDMVVGIDILDGFAGTGAVGIEALSRGARKVLFVEKDPAMIRCVVRNLEATGLQESGRIRSGDSRRVFPALEREGYRFGLIFLDPPYGSGDLEALMAWIGDSPVLQVGGMVVLEQGKRDPIFPWPRRLIVRKQYRYGDTRLTVFETDPAECRDRP